MSDIKQVIVIRKDLNMRKGKACVQAAHASMEFLRQELIKSEPKRETAFGIRHDTYLLLAEEKWINSDFKKICVTVNSEQELEEIYKAANKTCFRVHMITDLGLTEFDGPTKTCLAIGPDYSEKIDKITGKLPLY